MTKLLTVAVAAVSQVVLVAAQADTLHDNGVPDLQNAYHSDFDQSSPSDTVQVGDDFSLTQASILGTIQWWGIYAFDNSPPATEDFTIRIFTIQNGLASSLPAHEFHIGSSVVRTETSAALGDFYTMYSYSAAIPDTTLAPGSYLLSIMGNTVNTASDWYWATSNVAAGNGQERESDGSGWDFVNGGSQTVELAFNVGTPAAAVPEPGSIALTATGAAGLLVVMRRRKGVSR